MRSGEHRKRRASAAREKPPSSSGTTDSMYGALPNTTAGRERLNIETAVKQMERDADPGRIKTLFHRKNGGEWLVTMTAEDFLEVYKRWANENCTG